MAMARKNTWRRWPLGLVASCAAALSASAGTTITLLHNNDGESALLPDGATPDEGGIARFVELVNRAKAASVNPVVISSGDNFLAGKTWNASLNDGVFYDAEALKAIGYDAVILGNHEFDFGPDVLADFIAAANTGATTPFLSANLDFSAHAPLNALASAGTIAPTKTLNVGGTQVGIVGATTPLLAQISSPGTVGVNTNVVAAIQAQIDALTTAGVDHIVLVSHLQSVNEDLALIPLLNGVDLAIAGGGDELLASPGDPLLPSQSAGDIFGNYPLTATNLTGQSVPVVTTSGSYGYLGKLVVDFDAATGATVQQVESLPLRNFAGDDPFADGSALGAGDAAVKSAIEDPVAAFVAGLDANLIATTTQTLDGRRTSVRAQETGFGNLITDALVQTALDKAGSFGVTLDDPVVGFQNGGGIRNDVFIDDGTVSEGDTFDALPFNNFVVVTEDVSVAVFLDALENAVSRVEFGDGRFAQVSGFRFTYDPDAAGRVVDNTTQTVVADGSRVVDVFLEDGTQIVDDGVILDPLLLLDVVTIDFLLGDSDGYDWDGDGLVGGAETAGAAFTRLGTSYQQSLADYLTLTLAGSVTDSAYALNGEGRIAAIPEPATLALLALGGLAVAARRR